MKKILIIPGKSKPSQAPTIFELYMINNKDYTDFEVGKCLSEPYYDSGYSPFSDMTDCGFDQEIAQELYKQTQGQFRYVINIEITGESYFNGESTEYDSSYTYKIVSKEPSDYFDELYPINNNCLDKDRN